MSPLSRLIWLLLLAGCASPKPPATVEPQVSQYTLTCSVPALKARYSLPPDINSYDLQLLKTVESRWLELLGSFRYSRLRAGRVTVRFQLHSDGSIMRLDRLNNQVGEMQGRLCQKAILDPAPYARWPQSLAPRTHPEFREFILTFNYQ